MGAPVTIDRLREATAALNLLVSSGVAPIEFRPHLEVILEALGAIVRGNSGARL